MRITLPIIMLAFAAVLASAAPYQLTPIEVCPGCSTGAFGINNAGTITGLVFAPSGPAAFFGTAGNYTQFTVPGATFTEASEIRNDGTIAGNYFDAAGVLRVFVRAPDGTLTLPPLLPGAGAMNGVFLTDSGLMVGNIADDPFMPTQVLGYILQDFAFVKTFAVPGSFYTQAVGVNNAGVIVGYSLTSYATPPQSFIRAPDGTFAPFSVPGSIGSQLFDINNNGDLAGTYIDASGRQHGFISQGGDLTTLDYSGLDTIVARLNDRGKAVGYAFAPGAFMTGPYQAFAANAVPEPGSMALGGVGLVWLFVRAVVGRRRIRRLG